MKKFMILIMLFSTFSLSQQETSEWGKVEYSYQTSAVLHDNPGNSFNDESDDLIIIFYKTLISDVDGDNCPFEPSCSVFFAESIKENGLLTGIMMFADRLTRDMNFIERNSKYPVIKNGHYYDPPYLYTLQLTNDYNPADFSDE